MPCQIPLELRGRPFTLGEWLRAGMTARQLRHPRVRRLLRAVYVEAAVEDSIELRYAAVRLIVPPHAVVCSLTAAWLHGADVLHRDDLVIHVSFPKGCRIRSQVGLSVCQETLDPSDIVEVQGVKVTTPTRTAFDCLRFLRDPVGIIVADALTHSGATTPQALAAYFASKHRMRNLRIGEGRLIDIAPSADSPMESRTRICLVRRGVPRPTVPVYVFDAHGDFIGRGDMGYEDIKLLVEYDGEVHWGQQQKDERRRQRMRDAGWHVIVLYSTDIYGTPDLTAARVMAAIRRRQREFGVTL